ncbi:MAG: hypothetical protein PW843_27095 [Azospirillaceae bacterium]|nr:hypothetical protein [Azospirillaceae bacterium]
MMSIKLNLKNDLQNDFKGYFDFETMLWNNIEGDVEMRIDQSQALFRDRPALHMLSTLAIIAKKLESGDTAPQPWADKFLDYSMTLARQGDLVDIYTNADASGKRLPKSHRLGTIPVSDFTRSVREGLSTIFDHVRSTRPDIASMPEFTSRFPAL